MQRALLQYRDPKNYDLVYEALKRANRLDLVGFGKNCLIRPKQKPGANNSNTVKNKKNSRKRY